MTMKQNCPLCAEAIGRDAALEREAELRIKAEKRCEELRKALKNAETTLVICAIGANSFRLGDNEWNVQNAKDIKENADEAIIALRAAIAATEQ